MNSPELGPPPFDPSSVVYPPPITGKQELRLYPRDPDAAPEPKRAGWA